MVLIEVALSLVRDAGPLPAIAATLLAAALLLAGGRSAVVIAVVAAAAPAVCGLAAVLAEHEASDALESAMASDLKAASLARAVGHAAGAPFPLLLLLAPGALLLLFLCAVRGRFRFDLRSAAFLAVPGSLLAWHLDSSAAQASLYPAFSLLLVGGVCLLRTMDEKRAIAGLAYALLASLTMLALYATCVIFPYVHYAGPLRETRAEFVHDVADAMRFNHRVALLAIAAAFAPAAFERPRVGVPAALVAIAGAALSTHDALLRYVESAYGA